MVTQTPMAQVEAQKRWAQWSRLRWLLLISVILTRAMLLYFDGPLAGTDQGFQLAAAQSVLDGDKFSVGVFALNDISHSSRFYVTWWPPVFTYLAAPVLAFTHDPVLTLSLFTLLAITVIFVGWFIILEVNGEWISVAARVSVWLYWLFVAPPYVVNIGVTDLLSLGAFTVGVGLAMAGLKQSTARSFLWFILAALPIGISGALRYAYTPVLAVVPAGLVLIWFFYRQKRHLLLALVNAVSTILVFCTSLLLQLGVTSSVPLEILSGQVQISQLLQSVAPFPSGAFGLGKAWQPGSEVTTPLWIISVLILVVYFGVAVPVWVKAWNHRGTNAIKLNSQLYFHVVAGLTVLGTCALLFYLTVKQTQSAEWLFVEEMRYYNPIMGFLSIVIFGTLFSHQRRKSILRYVSMALVCVSITIGTLEGLEAWYFRAVVTPRGFTTQSIEQSDTDRMFVDIIRRLRAEGLPIAFLDDSDNNGYKAWASVAGASIHESIHFARIDQPILVTQPITVVVLLSKSSSNQAHQLLLEFIHGQTVISQESSDAYEVYVVEAKPAS